MANSAKTTPAETARTTAPASPSYVGHGPGSCLAHSGRRAPNSEALWIRGYLLIMASITIMFVLGLLMQGRIYQPNGGDILDILAFVGDVGAGGLYIVTRVQGWGHGAIAHATADYGTKFLIVAGLLNLICAADAYHIAIGKKP